MPKRNAPLTLVFMALISTAAVAQGAGLEPSVRVAGGLAAGAPGRDAAITVFKGLPFAAPPVGDLRWRAPQPVAPWTGVRAADRFGANCMQTIVEEKKPWTYEFMAHGPVSEDCLFLNVWTGARSAAERRPVYVYVHGGANTEGSGSVPAYDGEGLAREGVVVVTVNYRLGVLGFFTHPELTQESGGASGNYALLDLIAALRWVHDHIAAFGGDPGQRHARRAVGRRRQHAQPRRLAARQGPVPSRHRRERLRRGDRSRSAHARRPGAARRRVRARQGRRDAGRSPCPVVAGADRAAAGVGRGAAGAAASASASSSTATCCRGRLSTPSPPGEQNDVPTLTGANRHENGATPHPDITAAAFAQQARQRFGDLAAEFLSLYPAATDEQARVSQNDSAWDQARVSMHLWARHRAGTARSKAFTYFWDHALPGPDVETYGAFHTSEVPYVMNTLAMSTRPFTDADRGIADRFSTYVANFIRSGDPNGAGLPAWPAVSTDAGAHHAGRRHVRADPGRQQRRQAGVLREILRPAAPGRLAVATDLSPAGAGSRCAAAGSRRLTLFVRRSDSYLAWLLMTRSERTPTLWRRSSASTFNRRSGASWTTCSSR